MMMNPMRRSSGGTNASALLQKVSVQLSGGKIGDSKQTSNNDDEGLGEYLKSLSKKPVRNELQWDKFGELSDLSDSDAPIKQKPTATTAANKFLKKPVEQPVPVVTSKSQPGQRSANVTRNVADVKSSALGKVQTFMSKYGTGKSTSGAPTKVAAQLSDSDLDMSLSPDEDVLADVRAMKGVTVKNETITGNKPEGLKTHTQSVPTTVQKSQASVSQQRVESKPSVFRPSSYYSHVDEDTVDEDSKSSSVCIGKGAGMFLKKTAPVKSEIPEVKEVKTAIKPVAGKAVQSQPVPKTQPADKKQMTMAVLDTDDESLAEFMGGLTGSSISSHKMPNVMSKAKKAPIRDIHEPNILTVETIPDDEDTSHISETVSEAESDNFRFNIKDLDSLEVESEAEFAKEPPRKGGHSKSTSSSSRPSASSEAIQHKQKLASDADMILSHLGLHTIDELLMNDGQVDTDSKVSSEQQYESDFDSVGGPMSSRVTSPAPVPMQPLKSILSVTPRSMTPKSSRSRVRLMDDPPEVRSRSPSPVPTARSTEVPTEESSVIDTERSAATIPTVSEVDSEATDSETTAHAISDSEVSTAYSNRFSHQRRSRSNRRSSEPITTARSCDSSRRSSRRSSESSRRISEASYSEDFTTAVTAEERSESDSRRTSVTEGEEESTMSETHEVCRVKRSVPVRHTSVQTGLDVGLHYDWPTVGPHAVSDLQYGLAFVDPASVVTSVVSADALEAMTAYTPSALALNDMLKQQLHLTRNFIAIQTRLHHDLVTNLYSSSMPYHYTTLRSTKEYIRQHKRPVITFEEALKQVKEEMGML